MTPAQPSLARLTLVELRKMIDTRAGLWLQGIVVVLTLAVVVLLCVFAPPHELTQRQVLALAVQPSALLLPVLAILLVTSEWSQRTAQVTFTLVPRRSRVVVAKLAACVVLSLAALVLSIVVTLVASIFVGPAGRDAWDIPLAMLGQQVVFMVTATLGGAAFGALLLSSAPAIVIFFALPTAWSALGAIPALEGTARWLDGARSVAPLTDEVFSSVDWARAGTTLALWLVLPLVVGALRIERGDVR